MMKKILSAVSPCLAKYESYGNMSRSKHRLSSFFIFGAQFPKNGELLIKLCFSFNLRCVGACKHLYFLENQKYLIHFTHE